MNTLLVALPAVALTAAVAFVPPNEAAAGPVDAAWRSDPAWYDGKAEKCVYEATRSIYGVERRFLATAYTNKQLMDPRTTTKAVGDGVEVFKHHWSERVPTENYDYDFSTAVFVHTADLSPFKLTIATQDDCGSSFKQIWREDHDYRWLESVYFPGAGLREGRLNAADHGLVDTLTLTLRDYPFYDPDTPSGPGEERTIAIGRSLVPSQKSTRAVSMEPLGYALAFAGKETLDLPVGRVEAYRIDRKNEQREVEASYWFAVDGSAPWLHALVRFEGPDGVSYRLRSIERTAYWER